MTVNKNSLFRGIRIVAISHCTYDVTNA